MPTHKGGCHCGRVQFEIDAPAKIEATHCNCSICNMCGYLHFFVSRKKFRLLRGEENLTTYTFNSKVAKHHFCKNCGIKSFYVPRSHPDGVSINVHCLDPANIEAVSVSEFDGRNWDDNITQLSRISD